MKRVLRPRPIACLLIALYTAHADVPYNALYPVEKYQYAACVAKVLIISNYQNNVVYLQTRDAKYFGCLVDAHVVECLKGPTSGSRITFVVPVRVTEGGRARILKAENTVDAAGNIILSNAVSYHVILGSDGKGGYVLSEVVGESAWREYVGIHERVSKYGYDPQDPRRVGGEAVKDAERQFRLEWGRIRRDFEQGRISEEEFNRRREEFIEKWKEYPPMRRVR